MKEDPKKILAYALETYPQRVEVAALKDLAIDSARQNARRPAYAKIALPDEVIKQLRGYRQDGDLTLVVHVPREVIQRSESRIVLPGEV